MAIIPLTRRSFMALFVASLAAGPLRAGTREEAFVEEVTRALSNAARRGAGPAAYSRLITRYADVSAIGLAALGPYRQRLPRSLRNEYFAAVTRYMARAAAQNTGSFADGEFRVIGSRDGSVSGILEGPRPQRVDFRLSRRGSPRVRDVSMNGVWLAMQMRQIVVARLNRTRGNFDDLVAFLSSGGGFAGGN